jgi:hypothetical protein
VYLRNSNTQGIANIKFFFGDPGDVPLAGDFNGDGCGTVSIYRPSNQTFYIINKLGENNGGLGAAETSYVFGDPGDKAFVGDFNGNGEETVGLHRESTGLVYFRNSHTQGNADNQFIFGDPNDRLIAGDWNDDGMFSPALFRPSDTTMYFRYTNTQGNADAQFIVGSGSWLPVGGDWTPADPPPPPSPAVLAVASIKVEPVVGFAIPVPGIPFGTRELIAEFVDVDGDGAPSVGDVIRTDKYPKDFGTSNLGQFQVTEHVITTLDTVIYTAEQLQVVVGGGIVFSWVHTSSIESWTEEGPGAFSRFSDRFGASLGRESVITEAGSPSSPAEPVTNPLRTADPADNSWINVVITPPLP